MAGKKAMLQCLLKRGGGGGGVYRSKGGMYTRSYSATPEGLSASSSSSQHLINLESQRSAHKYVFLLYFIYLYLESILFLFFKIIILFIGLLNS